jgi:hypothetical protein
MGLMSEQPRLDEFDADEWFDVVRAINPALTREEFDASWEQFQEVRRRRALS